MDQLVHWFVDVLPESWLRWLAYNALTTRNAQITAAMIVAAGTITVFFIGKTIELIVGWRSEKRRLRQLRQGLILEINLNLSAIAKTLNNKERGRRRELFFQIRRGLIIRPSFPYANQDAFYQAVLSELPRLTEGEMKSVLEFYDALESIKADLGAVRHPVFKGISPKGRARTLLRIFFSFRTAHVLGDNAINLLNQLKPPYSKALVKTG